MKSDKCLLYANGAVAQLARAPALQAGGQEFDSPHLHHPKKFLGKAHWKIYRYIKKGKLEELESNSKVEVENEKQYNLRMQKP